MNFFRNYGRQFIVYVTLLYVGEEQNLDVKTEGQTLACNCPGGEISILFVPVWSLKTIQCQELNSKSLNVN